MILGEVDLAFCFYFALRVMIFRILVMYFQRCDYMYDNETKRSIVSDHEYRFIPSESYKIAVHNTPSEVFTVSNLQTCTWARYPSYT